MYNKKSSAVKLINAKRYNTYQLYAVMNNKNISLNDGLKIAALSTFSWLRERLKESGVLKELIMPEAKDYKKVNNEDFVSFSINEYFNIHVVSSMNEGIWTLRINENDTGYFNNGVAVEGRSIQTDIGYRIAGNNLECAFKTIISDTKDVEKAKCVRFALVKELATNTSFGLKQVVDLYDPNNMIIDENGLLEIDNILCSSENQLPLIIYTYDDNTITNLKDFDLADLNIGSLSLKSQNELVKHNISSNNNNNEDITARAIPYTFKYLGYARPYFLPKKMFSDFSRMFNINQTLIDEVFVIEPVSKRLTRYSYEDKDKYQDFVFNYTRDKNISFKDVLFVDEATVLIERTNEEKIKNNEILLKNTIEKMEQYKSQQARESRINEHVVIDDNKDELYDALSKLKASEETNSILNNEINRLKIELKNKNDYIEYINRKKDRPKKHKDIAIWADNFENIIIDKKAKDCLDKKDAENVDVDTICDALDFLNYVYAKYLFYDLTLDEVNDISSNIYNRPYNVTPSGIPISAKGDCKIKYAFDGEKRVEHILDQHLKIGRHGDILRIYFIYDNQRKKIVIGSLPNHLEY